MNDTLTNKRVFPSLAIIVYKSKGENYISDYYLESREIKSRKGKYVLMAPQALTSSVLKNIAQSYAKNNTVKMDFGGVIASHLIYAVNKPGHNVVMWHRPARQLTLNFDSALKIKGATNVHIPATLYVVINNRLYLYALMNNERPGLATKLYNAPFFNIYDDGNVCLGTAPIGRKNAPTYELEASRFEKGFFLAEQNGGAIKDKCKTPLVKLWQKQIKSKKPFPSKQELIQHGKYKTLRDIISKLIGDLNEFEDEEDY